MKTRITFRNMDESQRHVQKKQDANKKGKHNRIHTIKRCYGEGGGRGVHVCERM